MGLFEGRKSSIEFEGWKNDNIQVLLAISFLWFYVRHYSITRVHRDYCRFGKLTHKSKSPWRSWSVAVWVSYRNIVAKICEFNRPIFWLISSGRIWKVSSALIYSLQFQAECLQRANMKLEKCSSNCSAMGWCRWLLKPNCVVWAQPEIFIFFFRPKHSTHDIPPSHISNSKMSFYVAVRDKSQPQQCSVYVACFLFATIKKKKFVAEHTFWLIVHKLMNIKS